MYFSNNAIELSQKLFLLRFHYVIKKIFRIFGVFSGNYLSFDLLTVEFPKFPLFPYSGYI